MEEKEVMPEAPPEIVLQIRLTSEGQLLVTGQVIENEPLAFWLLDKGKDIIKAHNFQKARENAPKIVKGGMMNFARNIFKN